MTAEPRRVLIATLSLSAPNGTDVYTRDLALALLRRGWLPVVYAPVLGRFEGELRAATIPVVADLNDLGAAPDVIHGHHHLETLAAIARFPSTPALFVCHDSLSWHSIPPVAPTIGAYVAVDRNCRDRLLFEHRIAEEDVRILANAVDLARFARRAPLPEKPTRALVFANAARESNFVAPIREACEQRGISVDVVGVGVGKPIAEPERVLRDYDLVFAKARCALEAAASGTAVIVCDVRGMAGMMSTATLDAMRVLNFGARSLQMPVTTENVLRELDRYDPNDAAIVCDRIRQSADVDLLATQFIELYETLLETATPVSAEAQLEAVGASLQRAARQLYRENYRPASTIKRVAKKILNAPLLRPLFRLR